MEQKDIPNVTVNVATHEALYSMSGDLRHPKYGVKRWTVRSDDQAKESAEAWFKRTMATLEALYQNGWTDGIAETPSLPDETPIPPPTTVKDSGTAHCVMIEVGESFKGNKPQLIFKCSDSDDLRYTNADKGKLAQLLAEVGGFTEAHFVKGKKYNVPCLIDWELGPPTDKGKRYQNVLAVRRP